MRNVVKFHIYSNDFETHQVEIHPSIALKKKINSSFKLIFK